MVTVVHPTMVEVEVELHKLDIHTQAQVTVEMVYLLQSMVQLLQELVAVEQVIHLSLSVVLEVLAEAVKEMEMLGLQQLQELQILEAVAEELEQELQTELEVQVLLF